MKPSLERTERPDAGVRRVIRDVIRRRLQRGTESGTEEHVHGLRTVIKRVRAYLRLLRDNIDESWYRRTDSNLRDAARELSKTRDMAVLRETVDYLAKEASAAGASDALVLFRSTLSDGDPDNRVRTAVRGAEDALRAAVESLEGQQLEATDWSLLKSGLRRTYRRARRSMRRWTRSDSLDDAHRWRKHGKYLMFQIQLLQKAWPERLPALRRKLVRLETCLGTAHDLSMLEMAVTRAVADGKMSGDQAQLVIDEIGRGRSSNIRRAKKMGRKIFARRPREFVNVIGRRWQRWTRCKDAGTMPCVMEYPP